MQKVRHLFWDFDGTLYMSYPKMLQSMLKAVEELCPNHGISEEEGMQYMKVSTGHASLMLAQKLNLDLEALRKRYSFFHHQQKGFPYYEGLPECLRRLKDAGFHHYLYTHRDWTAVEQLESDGLWELFSGGVSKEDGFPLKPAPDALLSLMQKHGLTPEECAMVGDRAIDLEAGKNAGMKGILFDPDRYYQDYPADLFVYSMKELADKLLL